MKNINIKRILKIFITILRDIFALIGIILTGIYCFWELDMKMVCLDAGKIYDPEQKICRDDCLTWDEKVGCVAITAENIRKKEKGLSFD